MSRKDIVLSVVYLFVIAVLILIPTGFQRNIYYNSENARARILEVDNSGVYEVGIYKQGNQNAYVEFLSGTKKGEKAWGVNFLQGKMEADKIFSKGDVAFALIERDDDNDIRFVNLVDQYRISGEIIIALVFGILLIIFSGATGVRTIMSFVLAILSIFKLLTPLLLRGFNPLLVSLFVGSLISIFTILLVSGINRRSYSAITATFLCSTLTFVLSLVFKILLKIDGTELPWAESLIYAGFSNLDLSGIMQGAIYLSCSGAILDLAVDISSSLEEITFNTPDVSNAQLIKSGLNIGRTIVGSQTTTLLLAYMGSYISVMMVYMAQGTPLLNILTSKGIAGEILHTFVGCIGLIFVAPLTSFMYLFFKNRSVEL